MKKVFTLFVVLLLVLTQTSCSTIRWTYGHGVSKCVDWTQAREEQPEYEHYVQTSWLLGWVSAAGNYRTTELEKADSAVMVAWMDHYCRENSSKTIADGAKFVVEKLESPTSSPVFIPLYLPAQ